MSASRDADVFLEKSIGSLWRQSSASTVASRRILRSRVTASSSSAGDVGLLHTHKAQSSPFQRLNCQYCAYN